MTFEILMLSEIAEVKLGRQRSPKNHTGRQMRPYVRAANVGWSGWNLGDMKQMNFTDSEMETYRLRAGDLLLSEASGTATEVGKPALWEGQIEDCAFQNTLIRVRPRGVDPRYLLHYFNYCAASGRFAGKSRGVGIFHLGRKALAGWPVPVPPIDEQRRIAAVLDAADELRAKRRRALGKLDTLTQAIFIDMFHDTRARAFELNEIAEVQGGLQVTSKRKAHPVVVPYLRVANVYRGLLDLAEIKTMRVTEKELQRTRLEEDDLLVVEGHGNANEIGRVGVWDASIEPCVHQNHLIRVRCIRTRLLPLFASTFMNSWVGRRALLRAANTTSGLNTISTNDVRAVRLPLPQLYEQQQFVDAVKQVQEAKVNFVASARELGRLFASIQQRAFRGEL